MQSKKQRLLYPAVFLTAAILRFICYIQPFVYRIRPDDFGPLIYPAYLGGCDWRSFISTFGNYYGYGYYWIFAPLFRFIHSPKILLFAIAAINSLLIALCAVLILYLLIRYFDLPYGWPAGVLAAAVSLFQGTVDTGVDFWLRTDNEVPIYFAVWLTVWILLSANEIRSEEKAKRIRISLLMSLVLTWGLTVHERAMSLLIAVVLAEFLVFLLKKKWLLHPAAFFISAAAGYVLQRVLRNAVIHFFWLGGWPAKNTSAFSRVSLFFLESWAGFKALVLILMGNIHGALIQGFGLPAVAFVLVIVWMIRCVRERRNKSLLPEDPPDRVMDSSVLVMLVFIIGLVVVIAGLAVRWGSLLAPGIESGEVVYGYKGLTYSRYYYVFLGPLVLGSLVYAIRKRPYTRSVIFSYWIVFAAAELCFLRFVYPYCRRGGSNYIRRALGTNILFFAGPSIRVKLLVSALIMVLVLILYTWGVWRKRDAAESGTKKKSIAARGTAGICALVILFVFAVSRFGQVNPAGPSLFISYGEDTANVLTSLETAGVLPDYVYVPANKFSNGIQYIKSRIPLIGGTPSKEELTNSNLVISSKKSKRCENAGYYKVQCGDYNVYTNSEETYEALLALPSVSP